VAKEGYLSSSALAGLEPDAVGNAAALDVAKLLQMRVEDGDSLLASLKRGDHSALAALTDDANQLNEWIAGFSRALSPGAPASHKLAKQGYFPAGDGYHLLSPLFATSLVHAMHQKMVALRFGDEVKAIWKARREKTWHPTPLTLFRTLRKCILVVLNRRIFRISIVYGADVSGCFPASHHNGNGQKNHQRIYVPFSGQAINLTDERIALFSCLLPY
jgi:hypothetical protein